MSLPVGIGLAGLGRWGRNYAKALLALPECRFVAVADPDPTTRAVIAEESGIAAHESVAQLLSDPAIEAVVIATPDPTHYSLTSAALTTGRDVLVEKPMALEPGEAEALSQLAESGGRVLAVGHTAVYHPGFAGLIDETRARTPGAGARASAVRTSSGYSDGRSNPILDLCPHDIAMAVVLFGTPVAARAHSTAKSVEYEVRFQGDRLLVGQAEWREPPHVREFRVAGAGEVVEPANPMSTDRHSPFAIRHSPLGRQCLDFVECCRTRRQPLSSGRLGAQVVRCLGALAASSRNGGGWLDLYAPPASNGETTAPDSAHLTIGPTA